jgi:hypothetical protein
MGVVLVVVLVASETAILSCGLSGVPDADQEPPSVAVASKTQHLNPLASKCLAVTSPAEPAPITATSIMFLVVRYDLILEIVLEVRWPRSDAFFNG